LAEKGQSLGRGGFIRKGQKKTGCEAKNKDLRKKVRRKSSSVISGNKSSCLNIQKKGSLQRGRGGEGLPWLRGRLIH